MSDYSVVHLTTQLSLGGAGRSLIDVAGAAGALDGARHRVVSLLPPTEAALDLATQAGLEVHTATSVQDACHQCGASDILQVHFWNTPELYAVLSHGFPPTRTVLWVHVAGDAAPQMLTAALTEMADAVVATSPYSERLPLVAVHPCARMIYDTEHLERFQHVPLRSHEGFVVGYLGTVDPVKMHTDFIAMSAMLNIPDLTVAVYGTGAGFGALEEAARALGAERRFSFRGYTHDAPSALAGMDVFGYPLAPSNYSSADLVVQEAMTVGLPAVVFAHGGAQTLISDGDTGLVVTNTADYIAAIEWLHRHPDARHRIGQAAAAFARHHFGAASAARQLAELYSHLLSLPARPHVLAHHPRHADRSITMGAAAFTQSLGTGARWFLESLYGQDEYTRYCAEERIVSSGIAMAGVASGGVLHYRRCYPEDPYLRLWSGLILLGLGRPALAVGELQQAIGLGLASWRFWAHLATAASAANADVLARTATAEALRGDPHSAWAARHTFR